MTKKVEKVPFEDLIWENEKEAYYYVHCPFCDDVTIIDCIAYTDIPEEVFECCKHFKGYVFEEDDYYAIFEKEDE